MRYVILYLQLYLDHMYKKLRYRVITFQSRARSYFSLYLDEIKHTLRAPATYLPSSVPKPYFKNKKNRVK